MVLSLAPKLLHCRNTTDALFFAWDGNWQVSAWGVAWAVRDSYLYALYDKESCHYFCRGYHWQFKDGAFSGNLCFSEDRDYRLNEMEGFSNSDPENLMELMYRGVSRLSANEVQSSIQNQTFFDFIGKLLIRWRYEQANGNNGVDFLESNLSRIESGVENWRMEVEKLGIIVNFHASLSMKFPPGTNYAECTSLSELVLSPSFVGAYEITAEEISSSPALAEVNKVLLSFSPQT